MPRWQKLLRHDALIHRYKEAVRNAMAYTCPRLLGGDGPAGALDNRAPAGMEPLEPRLLLSASLAGTIFDDANGNGIQDAGEAGVENWTVNELSFGLDTTTDQNGDYLFANLEADAFAIEPDLKAGWNWTLPSNGQILIATDIAETGLNFGVHQGPVTYLVSTDVDESDGDYSHGDLSLREALALAALHTGDDIIQFDSAAFSVDGTLTLNQALGELVIDSNVDIQGLGADQLKIDAEDNSRVFSVLTDVIATIDGLTITRGDAGTGDGGGISTLGNLTVSNSVISDSSANYGGGIYDGNGIGLTILNSTVSGNTADTLGGGIFSGGSLVITNSTISGNDSLISSGGIMMLSGTLAISNSTITNNRADSDSDTGPVGGIAGGLATLGGTATLHNTIVAGNFAGAVGVDTADDIYGAYTSATYNVLGILSPILATGLGDASNQSIGSGDPRLAPLGDYGGPTPTHALLGDSQAKGNGDNTAGLATDQRGFARALTGAIDIGAFESSKPLFEVDNLVDEMDDDYSPGDLSLREALSLAALVPGADTITFDPTVFGSTHTIALQLGELVVDSNVIIEGPGADVLTIDAQELTRVFKIEDGVDATIEGLTITRGRSAGTSQGGGGIFSEGNLVLQSSHVVENQGSGVGVAGILGGYGTGIHQSGGTIQVIDSTISGNAGAVYGGGLYALNAASVIITNSTFSGNYAQLIGGGIAIFSDTDPTTATLTNLTIAANGTGVADFAGNPFGYGGGLAIGIDVTATINNTIIAGNTNIAVPSSPDVAITGTITSAKNNFIGIDPDLINGINDGIDNNQVGGEGSDDPLDPLLAPLADYGGPTPTHALLANSPAIDAGDTTSAATLTNDQRGNPRILGTQVDIGAYEAGSNILLIGDSTAAAGTSYNLVIRLTGAYQDLSSDLSISIDWGDDTPVVPTLTTFSDGQATVSHTYTTGLQDYDITVEFVDNSVTTQSVPLVVNVTETFRFDETGGSDTGKGSVVAEPGNSPFVVLNEGDSFSASLSQTFIVDDTRDIRIISFDDPIFSGVNPSPVNDAFEIALLGSDGQSLVPTIGSNRDAFFNWTAGQDPVVAPGATYNAGTVAVDYSHLADGTEVTVVMRLVNDDGGNGSSVRINAEEGRFWLWGMDNTDAELFRIFNYNQINDPDNADNKQILGPIYYRENNDPGNPDIQLLIEETVNNVWRRPEAFAINDSGIAYFTATERKANDTSIVTLFSIDLNNLTIENDRIIATMHGTVEGIDVGRKDHITGISFHPLTGELFALFNGWDDSSANVQERDELWILDPTITSGGTGAGTVTRTVVAVLDSGTDQVMNGETLTLVPSDDGMGGTNVTMYIADDNGSYWNNPDYLFSADVTDTSTSNLAISNLVIADNHLQGGLGLLSGKFRVEGLTYDAGYDRLIATDDDHHIFFEVDLSTNGGNTSITPYYFGGSSSIEINDIEGMAFVPFPISLPGNAISDPVGGLPNTVEFDDLNDVTGAFDVNYGVTSLNQNDAVLYATLTPTLKPTLGLRGPLLVGVTNISDPGVSLFEADGVTPDGVPFYDITSLADIASNGYYTPGVLDSFSLKFLNPAGDTFTYDLVFLSQVNSAPEFTNEPDFADPVARVVEIKAGNTFDFNADAFDLNGDDLVFSFVTKPAGLDFANALTGPDDGIITWDTTGETDASHLVTMKVEDGFGGSDTLSFTIKITDAPNRPPFFVQPPQPITEAYVNTFGGLIDSDLNLWSQIDFDVYPFDPVTWDTSDIGGDPAATSTTFGDPSILISDTVLDNSYIKGTLIAPAPSGTIGTFGVVFGYQDGGHFYLMEWRENTLTNTLGDATKGIAIKRVSTDTPLTAEDLWQTFPTSDRIETLYHNEIDTLPTVPLDFELIHLDTEFIISITDQATGDIVDTITIQDDSYQSGQFGFYTNAHTQAQFIDFQTQKIDDKPYIYTPDADDHDGDDLRFSLDTAPDGMLIDHRTGRIVWNATPDLLTDLDGLEVTVRVEDLAPNGTPRDSVNSFDIQPFNVLVSENPMNRAPIILTEPSEKFVLPDIPADSSDDVTPKSISLALAEGVASDPIPVSITLAATTATADIVFLIDGSGSMGNAWDFVGGAGAIPSVLPQIDSKLISSGITNNRYAVLSHNGTIISNFNDATTVATNTPDSNAGGGTEDGWQAIDHALANLTFRSDAVKNFVVVTDAGRMTGKDNTISFNDAKSDLESSEVLLNVILNVFYEDVGGNPVLGIDADGLAYSATGSPTTGGVAVGDNRTEGTDPIADYVNLALTSDADAGADFLGGAAWDLNKIRAGGSETAAFANVFSDLITKQTLEQINLQIEIDDSSIGFSYVSDETTPDDPSDFIVTFVGDGRSHNFNISFVSGDPGQTPVTLGQIPVAISNAYTYVVEAYDPDGDSPLVIELLDMPTGAQLIGNTVIWAPNTQGATGDFHVVVSDGNGGEDSRQWTVNVDPPSSNTAPTIITQVSEIGSPQENAPYDRVVKAEDSDIGDTVRFYLVPDPLNGDPVPSWLSIDRNTGRLSGTPPFGSAGNLAFTVLATDGRSGGETLRTYTTTIEEATEGPINAPPVLQPIATQQIIEGESLIVPAFAIDPEARPMTWSVSGPEGIEVTDEGSVVWKPDYNDVGTHRVVLFVYDDLLQPTSTEFSIEVIPLNIAPVFVTQALDDAQAGLVYEFPVFAIDPDGPSVTYSLEVVGSPAGVSFTIDSTTGLIEGSADSVGNYTLRVTATDTADPAASEVKDYELAVVAPQPNRAPTIDSVPRKQIGVGQTLTYVLDINDLDNDPLSATISFPAGARFDSATGTLTWRPDGNDVLPIGETHTITVTVDDGRGEANSVVTESFPVLVTGKAANQAPIINLDRFKGAVLGRTYNITLTATDPNEDPFTWELVEQSNPKMAINPNTGEFSWTPEESDLGGATVVIRAVDSLGLASLPVTLNIPVRGLNSPPGFMNFNPPTVTGTDATDYTYQVEATDIDQGPDPLSYTLLDDTGAALSAPYWLQIDAQGLISVTPGLAAPDTEQTVNLRVQISDGGFDVWRPFSIEVSNDPSKVNLPPDFLPGPVYDAYKTQTDWSFTTQIIDPEGNPVAVTLEQSSIDLGFVLGAAPAQATDPWEITWNVANQAPGLITDQIHNLIINATDTGGSGLTRQLTIPVYVSSLESNQPPVFVEPLIGSQSIAAGALFEQRVYATDPDTSNIHLTFELVDAAEGMQIDANGLIRWEVPADYTPGPVSVEVQVRDDFGATAAIPQTFVLTITADTTLPTVQLIANDDVVQIGGAVRFFVTVTDNVGVADTQLLVTNLATGLEQFVTLNQDPTNAGRLVGDLTLDAAGVYEAVATAIDVNDNSRSTPALQLTAYDPATIQSPVVRFDTAPANGDVIGSGDNTTVIFDVEANGGAIASLSYRLELIDNSGFRLELASGQQAEATDVSVKIPITAVPNGSYTLLLTASNGNLEPVYDTRFFSIDTGSVKIGDFSIGFTDMTVSTGGIPITIQRTYDTKILNRDSEDFGPGWTLALRDTGMTATNTTPAVGFDGVNGITNPGRFDSFIAGNAGQTGTIVAFTLPGGQREIFEFFPYEDPQFVGTTLFYPEFRARPGTTSSLTVKDRTLIMFDGFLVSESDLKRYNPANYSNDNYILTTRDGTVYEINSQTGEIISIEDRIGNTIGFNDNGATSKNADGVITAEVTFERMGPNGQISKILDQNGMGVTYGYNTDGRLISFTDRNGNKTTYGYGDVPLNISDDYLTSVSSEVVLSGGGTESVLLLKAKFETNADGVVQFIGLVDADGNSADFSYDLDGTTVGLPQGYTIETISDANGVPTEAVRDANGNLVRQITRLEDRPADDDLYQVTIFSYDADFNLIGQTKPFIVDEAITGENSRYLQEPGNLTTDPDSVDFDASLWRSVSAYDNRGNVTLQIDGEGNTTRFLDYDAFGSPQQIIDPNGTSTQNFYDPYNGLLRETRVTGLDANGDTVLLSTSVFNYDGNGNLKNVSQKDGNRTIEASAFTYNAKGQLTKTADPNGNERFFRYDDNGNQTLSFFVNDGKLIVSRTAYDMEGRVTDTYQYLSSSPPSDLNTALTSTDPAEIGTELTAMSAALLSSTSTDYDYAGRVESSTNNYGLTSTNRYDNRGNLVETRTPIKLSNGTDAILVSRSFFDKNGRTVASNSPFLINTSGDFINPATEAVDPSAAPDFLRATHTFYDDLGRVTETRQLRGVLIGINPLPTTTPQYETTFSLDYTSAAILSASLTVYNDQGQVQSTIQLSDTDGVDSFGPATDDGDQMTKIGETLIDPASIINDFSANEIIKTTFQYDDAGRQESSTVEIDLNQDGTIQTNEQITSSSTFDGTGRQVTSTDPNGLITRFKYDGLGRVYQTSLDDGLTSTENPVVQTFYDGLGRRATEVDALGRRTDYEYNDQGQLTAVTLPQIDPATNDLRRPRFEYHYDTNGNQTAIVNNIVLDPDGVTVIYYAKHNDGSDVELARRHTSQPYETPDRLRAIDSASNATANVTTFTYDHFNRQIKRTLPGGEVERMFYNDTSIADVQAGTPLLSVGGGQLAYSIDFEGRVTEYVYDNTTHSGGRLVQKKFHTAAGITVTDATTTANLATDLNGATPAESVTYAYDALGRQVSVDDSEDNLTVRKYDEQGRLTTIDRTGATDGQVLNYEYDDLGRLTRSYSSETLGGAAVTDTLYEYDALGRITKVTAEKRGGEDLGAVGAGGEDTHYFYDALGRIDFQQLANGLTQDMQYDDLGRLTDIVHFKDTNSDGTPDAGEDRVAEFSYSYDLAGNRTSAIERFDTDADGDIDSNDAPAQSFSWEYDGLNRLIQELFDKENDGTADYTDKFTFDIASNRATYTRTSDSGSFVAFTTTYTYDANDRLKTETKDAGSNGFNSADDRETTYTYTGTDQTGKLVENGLGTDVSNTTFTFNVRGRMAQVDQDTDGDGFTNVSITYTYDASGIRVEQEVVTDLDDNGTFTNTSTTTTTYTVDPLNPTGFAQVLEERIGGVLSKAFTLGLDVLAQTTDLDTTAQHHHFLYDAHGSTRALADNNGKIVDDATAGLQAFTFDAHGNLLATTFGVATQANALTSLLYSGELTDTATGQQYLRARYYNPANGRFNRLDPFAGNNNDPLSLHKYFYGNGNPIQNIDPTGNFGITASLLSFSASVFRYALNPGFQFKTDTSILSSAVSRFDLDSSATIDDIIYAHRQTQEIQLSVTMSELIRGIQLLPAAQEALFEVVHETINLNFEIVASILFALPFSSACFTGDTPVVIGIADDGTVITKPISELRPGDKVMAKHESSLDSNVESRPVEDVFCREASELQILTIKCPGGGDEVEIRTTPAHPIWVIGKGWTDAKDISAGDHIAGVNTETSLVLDNILHRPDDVEYVYTLRVAQDHTYFVADKNKTPSITVWAHNACAGAKQFEDAMRARNGIPKQSPAQRSYVSRVTGRTRTADGLLKNNTPLESKWTGNWNKSIYNPDNPSIGAKPFARNVQNEAVLQAKEYIDEFGKVIYETNSVALKQGFLKMFSQNGIDITKVIFKVVP